LSHKSKFLEKYYIYLWFYVFVLFSSVGDGYLTPDSHYFISLNISCELLLVLYPLRVRVCFGLLVWCGSFVYLYSFRLYIKLIGASSRRTSSGPLLLKDWIPLRLNWFSLHQIRSGVGMYNDHFFQMNRLFVIH